MLSIIINVKNGEKYLRRCLLAVQEFPDVVLLDNYSTDNTMAIAREFPKIRTYQHEFMGMGRVRNLAASYTLNDWVLFVDCDEILSPFLVQVLLNFSFEAHKIYLLLRQNYYDNKLIDSSSWGNDWIKRIYNKCDTQFSDNEVHDSFVDDLPTVKILGGVIYHYPYDNVAKLIDKMQFYSALYAKQHFLHKKPKLWTIPLRSLVMFIKCYILKAGFKDGYEGLIISAYNAMGVFSKYVKLYELYYKKSFGLAIAGIKSQKDIDSIIKKINSQTKLPNQVFLYIEADLLQKISLDEIEQSVNYNLITNVKLVALPFVDAVFADAMLLDARLAEATLADLTLTDANDSYQELFQKRMQDYVTLELNQDSSLEYIIYLDHLTLLKNKNFLLQCYNKLYKFGHIDGLQVFVNKPMA